MPEPDDDVCEFCGEHIDDCECDDTCIDCGDRMSECACDVDESGEDDLDDATTEARRYIEKRLDPEPEY